jgi:hypothetical protein
MGEISIKNSADFLAVCYNKLMTKTRKKKFDEILQTNRAVMASARRCHFESGGDLASWRGRSNVYVDQKKQKNKHACRKNNRSNW